jgi:PilZ domain
MRQERRRTQRHIVNGAARIRSHLGSPAYDCLVTDASDGGIRLFADGIDVPDEFILVFDGTGDSGRKCRVVWRLDAEIGAEFVESNEEARTDRMT